MHIGIHHMINDVQKWNQGTKSVMGKIQGGTLPAGMKPVFFIPATDQKTTFCVWEADSVNTVKKFIDQETGTAARNEYFEVDTKNSLGLPEVAVGKK
jgi:hypothetical protein